MNDLLEKICPFVFGVEDPEGQGDTGNDSDTNRRECARGVLPKHNPSYLRHHGKEKWDPWRSLGVSRLRVGIPMEKALKANFQSS